MDNGKIVCFLIINPPTIILLFSFLIISSLKFTSLQFYFVAIKLFWNNFTFNVTLLSITTFNNIFFVHFLSRNIDRKTWSKQTIFLFNQLVLIVPLLIKYIRSHHLKKKKQNSRLRIFHYPHKIQSIVFHDNSINRYENTRTNQCSEKYPVTCLDPRPLGHPSLLRFVRTYASQTVPATR